MTIQEIKNSIAEQNQSNELMQAIDSLDNLSRSEIRAELEAEGVDSMPRSLFFNYKEQVWID